MVKLKDIATIQTGIYLKNAPSPDTCYLQVNDFDEEGNILASDAFHKMQHIGKLFPPEYLKQG